MKIYMIGFETCNFWTMKNLAWLLLQILRRNKVKYRQFSSPFFSHRTIFWKNPLTINGKFDSFSKKICNYFLPIHNRSATINFWKRHTWKSRQKLSMDFVTLKNGDTPTYSYVPSSWAHNDISRSKVLVSYLGLSGFMNMHERF